MPCALDSARVLLFDEVVIIPVGTIHQEHLVSVFYEYSVRARGKKRCVHRLEDPCQKDLANAGQRPQ